MAVEELDPDVSEGGRSAAAFARTLQDCGRSKVAPSAPAAAMGTKRRRYAEVTRKMSATCHTRARAAPVSRAHSTYVHVGCGLTCEALDAAMHAAMRF